MNAAETIAAAIQKLESLRLDADALGRPKTNPDRPVTSALAQLGFDTEGAQLAILRDASQRLAVEQNPAGVEIHYRNALLLARAILGDAS